MFGMLNSSFRLFLVPSMAWAASCSKIRADIEYARKYASDYHAAFFIYPVTPSLRCLEASSKIARQYFIYTNHHYGSTRQDCPRDPAFRRPVFSSFFPAAVFLDKKGVDESLY